MVQNAIRALQARLMMVATDETGMSTVEYEVIWTHGVFPQVDVGVFVV